MRACVCACVRVPQCCGPELLAGGLTLGIQRRCGVPEGPRARCCVDGLGREALRQHIAGHRGACRELLCASLWVGGPDLQIQKRGCSRMHPGAAQAAQAGPGSGYCTQGIRQCPRLKARQQESTLQSGIASARRNQGVLLQCTHPTCAGRGVLLYNDNIGAWCHPGATKAPPRPAHALGADAAPHHRAAAGGGR
jgi:hypothetical protein